MLERKFWTISDIYPQTTKNTYTPEAIEQDTTHVLYIHFVAQSSKFLLPNCRQKDFPPTNLPTQSTYLTNQPLPCTRKAKRDGLLLLSPNKHRAIRQMQRFAQRYLARKVLVDAEQWRWHQATRIQADGWGWLGYESREGTERQSITI